MMIIKELEELKNKAERQQIILKTPEPKISFQLEVIPEIPDTVSPLLENFSIVDPIVSVQALIRGYAKRKNISKLNNAAIIIQKHIRCYQCYIIYKSVKEAIVCIQSNYRGHLLRKNLKKNS